MESAGELPYTQINTNQTACVRVCCHLANLPLDVHQPFSACAKAYLTHQVLASNIPLRCQSPFLSSLALVLHPVHDVIVFLQLLQRHPNKTPSRTFEEKSTLKFPVLSLLPLLFSQTMLHQCANEYDQRPCLAHYQQTRLIQFNIQCKTGDYMLYTSL